MDPICHTLVGASLGCTGLERRTRYGRATLIIAANLPDIDVVAHYWGNVASYAFRRGITHGIPALFVLPFVLAFAMWSLSRMRPDPDHGPDASFRWLLILSAIGVASHPALDWLNNYGMRWLMPIDATWSYGDTLFIIDPVVWAMLLAGLIGTRRLGTSRPHWPARPAVAALAVLLAYIGMNLGITRLAESTALRAAADHPPERIMASPVPFNPFAREIVLAYPDRYRFGTVSLDPLPTFAGDELVIDKGDPELLERARLEQHGRWFLGWARFPFVAAERDGTATIVYLADARYVRDVRNPRLDGFGVIGLRIGDQAPE